MYHVRIIHLCNVKEAAPLKRLILKSLIYLFFYFMSWLHNIDDKGDEDDGKGKEYDGIL